MFILQLLILGILCFIRSVLSANIVIGETKVLLSPSRIQESNLGNFITDSMVEWVSWLILIILHFVSDFSFCISNFKFVNHPKFDQGLPISLTAGLINSGGIRGSFDVGNITLNDLVLLIL